MAPDRLLARRRGLVVFIYILSAMTGTRAPFEPKGLEPVLCSLVIGVAMTWFCMTDSKVRGKPLAWSLQWLILLTRPVFAPIYLVATRGLRRLHWVLLAVAGFLVASWIPYLAIGFIVYGIAGGE